MHKKIYRFFHSHYHRRYHGLYRHAKKLFVFDLGLLALSILMLGASLFFFFWNPGIANLVDISISLGNERLRSGDNVCLNLSFTNGSKYHLKNATLGVHLPEGFVIDRTKTPENVFFNNSTFDLGEIEPSAKGQRELCGEWWADLNKEERVLATVTFTSEKMKDPEQSSAVLLTKTFGGVLSGNFSISTSSLPNASLPWRFELENTASRPINNISLSHNWTETAAVPALFNNITLNANETKIFEGTLKVGSNISRQSVSIVPKVTVNSRAFAQTVIAQNISVLTPTVRCVARLKNPLTFAEVGQIVSIVLETENIGRLSLSNTRVEVAEKTGGVVNWGASGRTNRVTAANRSLIINKNNRTALSRLNSGEKDDFELAIQLLPHFSLGQKERASLNLHPQFEAELPNLPAQKFRANCAEVQLPLATELGLATESRYYTEEGDQLGRGPLPPVAGETTKYWIFVRLFNSSNPIENSLFTTTLPAGVQFTGRQSVTIGQPLRYNSANRTVSWNHSSLPAHSQTGLYFEVAVTPSPSQVGQELQLTNSLNFSATDDFTDKKFTFTKAGLKNLLSPNDDGARMGAKVVGN